MAHGFGQPAVVRVPEVVLPDLRDVRLGPCPHRRDDGLPPAQGFDEQGTLRGDGVDGVDDEVVALVEQGGHVVGREVGGAGVEADLGIDVEKTAGEDVHFFQSYRRMQGRQLAVDVRGSHVVGVDEGQPPDACAAEHLGGVGAHAARPDDGYRGVREAVASFFAQHEAGAFLPVADGCGGHSCGAEGERAALNDEGWTSAEPYWSG